jgi:hypothetical protein
MRGKKLVTCLLLFLLLPVSVFSQSQEHITPAEKVVSRQNHMQKLRALADPSLIKPLSATEIRAVIKTAIDWIRASQEENGHFRYEYVPYKGTYSNEDNIVRQAGMLYQLGEIAQRDTNNLYRLDKIISRAIHYLQNLTKNASYKGVTFRCITDSNDGGTCKVGATSLAVIGIIGFVEARPAEKSTYALLIEEYMAYIRAMRKDNAGFRNIFYPDTGIAGEEESSYGNGEALLALVRYGRYKQFPPDIKKEIDGIITYLRLHVPQDVALYLWAMAALKDLHAVEPKKEYFEFARMQTDSRKGPFLERRHEEHNYCSYIEGVTSAYPILRNHLSPDAARLYKEEIDFWLAKSALLQVKPPDLMVSDLFGSARFVRTPNPERALGGFLTGHYQPTQRIDFTQHCVSAYVQTLIDIEGLSF